MADPNVSLSVSDPDRLLAGTSPFAPFVAALIKLYRYSTEALARADTSGAGGTLVTTFTIVASTTAAADPNIAGPYRFGVYDASQGAGSWYRYNFTTADGLTLSPLSEPWQSDNRDQWALRDVMYEVGNLMGGSVKRATAETNAVLSAVKVTSLFKSTVQDARLYEGQWVFCSRDNGGAAAAPEMEEALIASVDVATGTATLERDLAAAITAGDTVLVSAYIQPSELIRCINRAREEMEVIRTLDIALASQENRYPAPAGVFTEEDVIDALGIFQYANSNREDEYPIHYEVEFDGYRGWVRLDDYPERSHVARLRYKQNYRDLEGELTLMAHTTSAPIQWLRVAAALKTYEWLVEDDPAFPTFQQLTGMAEDRARMETGRFAPTVTRRIKRRRGVLPGPPMVA